MTPLTALLGIDLPIVQAPMAGVQDSELAIAVSNAGGLGSLPCALLTIDAMRRELAAIAAQTSRPYNANFFCHPEPLPHAGRDAAWREALRPYYREMSLDETGTASGPAREPFTAAVVEALAEFRPPVVSFHFGLPPEALLEPLRRWGAKILSTATTVDEARWLEARGVDAIVAQGVEAGGHRGIFLSADLGPQLGTLALVPQVIDAVTVPVIAAGGIADARGVAAALALGAAGVQVGTAYLLCPETRTSPVHRAALKSAGARHTVLTNVFTGRPARSLVNRIVRELGPMSPVAPEFPLAAAAVAPLRAAAEARGSEDFSPLWAGQNSTRCREIPAADLTRELAGAVVGDVRRQT